MKRKIFLFAIVALAFSTVVSATPDKENQDPAGVVSYCLPNTSLSFEVEAICEMFHAGPYAKFAQKYLGVDARQEDGMTYRLAKVKMIPFIEADQSSRYFLKAGNNTLNASFLRLTSCGLIASADANFGDTSVWRFPVEQIGNSADDGLVSNFASEETTLYRNVQGEDAYTRVAVQQQVVVAKSLEQKASETASLIFDLRKKRIAILTGDTDATYSGEALGAAVAEIERLEKEYMSMFVGYSSTSVQTMKYDLVPVKDRTMYVVFRFSETAGLLLADDLSGKPVALEITPQQIAKPSDSVSDAQARQYAQKGVYAVYRIPAVCTLKLTDGTNLLMNTRLPVYQYGVDSTFPLATIVQ